MPSAISNGYAAVRNYFGGTLLGDTGVFFHLSAYLFVNAILIAVNLLLTPHTLWFIWPLLGWGIGILAHALAVNFSKEEAVRRRTHTRDARIAAQRTPPAGS